MRRNIILGILGLSLSLISCQKEEVFTFNQEESGVYFLYTGGISSDGTEQFRDSVNLSFGVADLDMARITAETVAYILYGTPMTPLDKTPQNGTELFVNIPIHTLGKVKGYDRPIKVLVDNERTTAIKGEHYDIDLDTVKIKAGKSSTQLRVRVIRSADMLENIFQIAFKLEENEHFNLYFQEQKNINLYTSTGAQIDATRFMITASEIYTEPSYWRQFCLNNYFGTWSARKYVFVNNTLNWSDAEWIVGGRPISNVQQGRFSYGSSVVQRELQRLADAGIPMTEADGSYMQLSNYYLVDYSAYE